MRLVRQSERRGLIEYSQHTSWKIGDTFILYISNSFHTSTSVRTSIKSLKRGFCSTIRFYWNTWFETSVCYYTKILLGNFLRLNNCYQSHPIGYQSDQYCNGRTNRTMMTFVIGTTMFMSSFRIPLIHQHKQFAKTWSSQ